MDPENREGEDKQIENTYSLEGFPLLLGSRGPQGPLFYSNQKVKHMNGNMDLRRKGNVKTASGFEELTLRKITELAENRNLDITLKGNQRLMMGRANGV